ncbi:MAG: hypothetical protein M9962_03655 [Oligoflexia bacterium]|nr:hypothetical protein [Oligoflexia bacterium]
MMRFFSFSIFIFLISSLSAYAGLTDAQQKICDTYNAKNLKPPAYCVSSSTGTPGSTGGGVTIGGPSSAPPPPPPPPPPCVVAGTPCPPPAGGGGTVVGGPAPAPSPPPAAAPTAPNAADTWVAEKTNTGLFNNSVEEQTASGQVMNEDGVLENKLMIDQRASFQANANSMYNCVDTSISGRTDTVCASDPTNPECVGLNSALNNSTNCAMLAPDGVTCLAYGANGYTGEEWLAFGTQYFDGMLGCFSAHTENATVLNTDTGENKLENLTDIVSGGSTSATTAGVLGFSAPGGSSSDISASSKNKEQSSKNTYNQKSKSSSYGWEYFAEKINDGASYIGYNNGEIFKRAEEKESFLTVFTDSPFYQNKLNKKQQASSEEAINYPQDPINSAKEKYAAKKEERELNGETVAEASSENKDATANDLMDAINSQIGHEETQQPIAGGSATYSLNSSDNENKQTTNLPYYNKEVVAELAARRSLASVNNPSQSEQLSALRTEDLSIFERVSLTYRKVSPHMKSLESQTGKDLRRLDTPTFFKNL